jgi:acyl-lipid omega-6 desaturase (Delta-12 desaturase)
MEKLNTISLRPLVSKYTKTSTNTALTILSIDLSIYISAIIGILYFENIYARIICGIIAGFKMASLFVIAHDAAHDSYTSNKLLNLIIGRLAFLPCYHNYSLWLIAHNRQHHQFTNIKAVNSWFPLSKSEYDSLPIWRRLLERLYRSPLGISLYYLVERWWKNKFYPYKRIVNKFEPVYWVDFILTLSFLIGQVTLFGYMGHISTNSSFLISITLGFFVPLFVFSFMVGFSVYQQHTHESVAWFNTKSERDRYAHIQDFTVHVKYPKWYNVISHNVMEHTAHHVDPRIPCYHLAEAQKEINDYLANKMVSFKFSALDFIKTMNKCKLYDYDNHRWLDFNGYPESKVVLYPASSEMMSAT